MEESIYRHSDNANADYWHDTATKLREEKADLSETVISLGSHAAHLRDVTKRALMFLSKDQLADLIINMDMK